MDATQALLGRLRVNQQAYADRITSKQSQSPQAATYLGYDASLGVTIAQTENDGLLMLAPVTNSQPLSGATIATQFNGNEIGLWDDVPR